MFKVYLSLLTILFVLLSGVSVGFESANDHLDRYSEFNQHVHDNIDDSCDNHVHTHKHSENGEEHEHDHKHEFSQNEIKLYPDRLISINLDFCDVEDSGFRYRRHFSIVYPDKIYRPPIV